MYLLLPDSGCIWCRLYICFSCSFCSALEFLKCTNTYCGERQFFSFYVNSNTLSKLLSPYFEEKQQVHKKKEKTRNVSKSITQIISKYY